MIDNKPIAFPSRPIQVVEAGAATSITSYLFALMLAILVAFLLWLQGPGIWRDAQIKPDFVVVEDSVLRQASCKTRKAIFHTCTADVSYKVDGKQYQSKVELAFFSLHRGSWNVDVVRSRAHPELVTLDLGIDMLWNRVLLTLGLTLLMLTGIVVLLRTGGKNRSTKAMEGKMAQFTGVSATLEKEDAAFGKTVFNFKCVFEGKTREFTSAFKRGDTPFYLGNREDEALVVIPHKGAAPILMDRALNRLALTEQERDSLQVLATA